LLSLSTDSSGRRSRRPRIATTTSARKTCWWRCSGRRSRRPRIATPDRGGTGRGQPAAAAVRGGRGSQPSVRLGRDHVLPRQRPPFAAAEDRNSLVVQVPPGLVNGSGRRSRRPRIATSWGSSGSVHRARSGRRSRRPRIATPTTPVRW